MMNHYIGVALRIVSQASNRLLLSVKTLFNGIDLPNLLRDHKRLLAIFLLFLSFTVLLTLLAKPYLEVSQTLIALKIAQSNHLKSLFIESKAIKSDGQLVKTFDDQELENFRKILLGKGMAVSHLSMNATSDASIEMQLKHVSFASFIDVLNQSRDTWHLYPLDVSINTTDTAGIVDVKTTLKQFRSNQSPPSSASQN